MAGPTTREQIMRRFNQVAGPNALSFSSLLEALSPPYSKGTISARLSELVQEGVLERDSRGTYSLAYEAAALSPALREVASNLEARLPRLALPSIVLWDATPFLNDREDGVLAPVLVVETAGLALGSVARMLRDHWRARQVPHIEAFADRDTLLEAVFGEMELQAPRGARLVLVGPSEEQFASTALQKGGLRIAMPERVIADLLEQDDPSLAAIVRLRLTSERPELDAGRLFAACQERGIPPSLFVVAGALSEELPPGLRNGLNRRVTGAARVIAEVLV